MSEAMGKVPDDDPMMIAWEKYKLTESYANTKKWAIHVEHVEGSLWAVFSQGFLANRQDAVE